MFEEVLLIYIKTRIPHVHTHDCTACVALSLEHFLDFVTVDSLGLFDPG